MKALYISPKNIILTLAIILTVFSCKKALEEEQASNESKSIESFLSRNKLTFSKTNGVYHVTQKKSFGYQVAKGDTVRFDYVGYTLDGLVFETNIKSEAKKAKLDTLVRTFEPLKVIIGKSNLIEGLENGLKLLREGEEAIIVFPSTMGYGGNALGLVEPNSPLAFYIKLISVNGAKIQEEISYISGLNLSSEGYTEHLSGLYYKFNPEGAGIEPTENDTIYGWYKGTLFDGTVIDEILTSNKMIVLSSKELIEGVRQGFLLTKKDGVTELILPSYLGFGIKGNSKVKPYETVKYMIRLDSIKNDNK